MTRLDPTRTGADLASSCGWRAATHEKRAGDRSSPRDRCGRFHDSTARPPASTARAPRPAAIWASTKRPTRPAGTSWTTRRGNPPRRAEPPLERRRGAEPERREGGDRGGDCLAFHRAISASEGTKDCARRAIVAGIPTGPGRTTRGSPPWTRITSPRRSIRPDPCEIAIAAPTWVPRTGIILVESPEEFTRVESGNDRPGTGDRPCDHEPRS